VLFGSRARGDAQTPKPTTILPCFLRDLTDRDRAGDDEPAADLAPFRRQADSMRGLASGSESSCSGSSLSSINRADRTDAGDLVSRRLPFIGCDASMSPGIDLVELRLHLRVFLAWAADSSRSQAAGSHRRGCARARSEVSLPLSAVRPNSPHSPDGVAQTACDCDQPVTDADPAQARLLLSLLHAHEALSSVDSSRARLRRPPRRSCRA